MREVCSKEGAPRDAWLIALGNSFTSVYAGFVVFGTLGMLAEVRALNCWGGRGLFIAFGSSLVRRTYGAWTYGAWSYGAWSYGAWSYVHMFI